MEVKAQQAQQNTLKIGARCPIRTTLEMLGGKWKLLIIYQLYQEKLRLSEIRRRIPGISEKMLIQELKSLTDSNLVKRINYGEVPPRVEYQLTEMGAEVIPLIDHLRDFGVKYDKFLMNNG